MRFSRVALILLLASSFVLAQSREEKSRDKYYEKWHEQDVDYIISDDERAVFKKLQTPEEKDVFIEEFWRRRSPNPTTSPYEFKEEHYRRIAYANAKFGSGIPGWKTDRGRIYIMFGEPAEIEDNAGGGNYYRKPYEGGGRTTVFPFQVWRYRHIEGIGDDIEIEFVDQSWTGLYKIAQNAWEKDLLLNVSDQGQTFMERLKLASKATRPGIHPGNINNMSAMKRQYGMRLQDMPFQRMLRYHELQRAPVVRHKELRSIVETQISYNNLPFGFALNHIWIDGEQALVPITLEIDNNALTFQELAGSFKARVGLYGAVTSLGGRMLAEFEDSIATQYPADRFPQAKHLKSMYQKPVLLPAGLYRLDLVVKDMIAGTVGTISTRIAVPAQRKEVLSMSPPVMAKIIQPMDNFPEAPTTFVIGDLKVVPNITRAYKQVDPLNVYFQVYNAAVDPATNKPKLVLHYSILQGDKQLLQLSDQAANSVAYSTEQRVVATRRLSLETLAAGDYKLKIEVRDAISGQSAVEGATFKVIAP